MKSEQINYMIKHRVTGKIWITWRKLLKKCVNTEYLHPDRCLRHFATLFTNNSNEILLKEVQILGPAYIDKLDVLTTLLLLHLSLLPCSIGSLIHCLKAVLSRATLLKSAKGFHNTSGKKFYFEKKNNKASGYDDLPTEVWQRLVIKGEGIQKLMKLFNTIRNRIMQVLITD
jgi:hypothetical protein